MNKSWIISLAATLSIAGIAALVIVVTAPDKRTDSGEKRPAASKAPRKGDITITVKADGSVELDGKPTSPAALGAALGAAASARGAEAPRPRAPVLAERFEDVPSNTSAPPELIPVEVEATARGAKEPRPGAPVLAVRFEDMSSNTWAHLRPVLAAAAAARIRKVRLGDVLVVLPGDETPDAEAPVAAIQETYSCDTAIVVTSDSSVAVLKRLLQTGAAHANLKGLAEHLKREGATLACGTRTPVARLLAVVNVLTEARVRYVFAAGPYRPNEETDLTVGPSDEYVEMDEVETAIDAPLEGPLSP